AAMGGVPKFALVAAQLPSGMSQEDALRINAGLRELADSHGVSIVGGETTLSMAGIGLTITLVGEMSGLKPVLRSGAREGNVILVTGGFGGSILGKHARFEPRLAEGRWLAERGVT